MLFASVGMCMAWSFTTIGGIPGLIFCLLTPAMAWLLVDALKPAALSTVGNVSFSDKADQTLGSGIGSIPDPRKAKFGVNPDLKDIWKDVRSGKPGRDPFTKRERAKLRKLGIDV